MYGPVSGQAQGPYKPQSYLGVLVSVSSGWWVNSGEKSQLLCWVTLRTEAQCQSKSEPIVYNPDNLEA